ncbi:hypothetical protein K431DRAFT_250073 [Polychaeton citri CBS 116435]|uniref:Zn(2)-C6 fungal-type domain-containing protein n=1 Tax=Polychaeton citri CBS 116435 TaxID=1314669 RepID=A0A9P4Q647_9PEZI|nr:hypothetical protein K431DRAFT_250073 [Polychaeton citri CBS 116435]
MSESALRGSWAAADQTIRKTTARRRNGWLPACEPCRKRKLKCDHNVPVCGRCNRRAGVDKCIYHPAPLSRQFDHPFRKSLSPRLASDTQLDQGRRESVSELRDQSPIPEGRSPVRATVHGDAASDFDAVNIDLREVGFLGTVSCGAVVAEINDRLGVSGLDDAALVSSQPMSESRMIRGAEVLRHFRDLDFYLALVEKWMAAMEGDLILTPIMRTWSAGVRPILGVPEHNIYTDVGLKNLSRLVSRNTQTRIRSDGSTTALGWAAKGTGDRLRWETIGILFSIAGLIAGSMSSHDPVFRKGDANDPRSTRSRWEVVQKSMFLVDSCVRLSQECGDPNDMTLALLYESAFLIQRIWGETSFLAYRRMGEVCDYAVALGLHQEKRVDAQTPFWLCQTRVRLFALAYSYDKFQATHLGRPPRLSRRYCAVQLPLDMSDEEICSDEPALSAALAGLDKDGWNSSGLRHRHTWKRAWQRLLPLREDILEFASATHDESLDTGESNIRSRLHQVASTMPAFCLLDPGDLVARIRSSIPFIPPGSTQEWRPLDTVYFFNIHCVMRHTEFLLERTLALRRKTSSAALIISARALLNSTLQFFSLREFLVDFSSDLVTLLSLYSVPSAGVLGIELLKQDQAQIYHPSDFPRSEVIQQLSVLISALETVRPDEGGNYTMCGQSLVALRGLLNKILAPKAVVDSAAVIDEQALFPNFPPDSACYNDHEFLQWLQDMGWNEENL